MQISSQYAYFHMVASISTGNLHIKYAFLVCLGIWTGMFSDTKQSEAKRKETNAD
ncbi:hypothetical protein LRP50_15540 [Enterovibrio sp. ZSDZ42]|uniref:Uncharacterized protein n=1 Tax=Enterovibrio gelatinilyticus TaxID=2899819 RepID=A0ABT5R3T6_9GAMM|nr:hypothetical protein [Enterovibrio sp. ZSDZ42]MDD1794545.1 hypothetical protein [Enterovibrio sp. ZSDZ42]